MLATRYGDISNELSLLSRTLREERAKTAARRRKKTAAIPLRNGAGITAFEWSNLTRAQPRSQAMKNASTSLPSTPPS